MLVISTVKMIKYVVIHFMKMNQTTLAHFTVCCSQEITSMIPGHFISFQTLQWAIKTHIVRESEGNVIDLCTSEET